MGTENRAPLNRRALLKHLGVGVGGVAVGAAIGQGVGGQGTSKDSGQPQTNLVPPPPAQSVGFTQLLFQDDFLATSSIDLSGTGAPGFRWYVDLPYGWGQTPTSALDVKDSVLTIRQTAANANWAICSTSPKSGLGHTFRFGFFEARIRFDPELGKKSAGFPAFWSLATEQFVRGVDRRCAELDFFEAWTPGFADYDADFYGTIHDRVPNSLEHHYRNEGRARLHSDFSDWHTVGCLWVPGRTSWFLDYAEVIFQSYSATTPPTPPAKTEGSASPIPSGTFSILDDEPLGMSLILGSGPQWPLQIDWVRVWR